jgi:hypothetical protein
MKKILLPVFSLVLALTPVLTRAEPATDKPKQEQPKHDDTELGKSMDVMSKAWRKLRRQADKPDQNAGSLELVATIQAAAKKGLEQKPDLARDQPADKQAEFVAGYQKQMKAMIAALEQLEAAFKANDNKTAGEIITKINAMQKEGHKEYKRPE